MQDWTALLALTVMEIILGIDNIVFIAILTSRLPVAQRSAARRIGLAVALVMRLLLLALANFIKTMENPFFYLSSMGIATDWLAEHPKVDGISGRDLILLGGGLFLIAKSVHEIHNKFEGEDEHEKNSKPVTFGSVLFQIALLDMVFSLDSVITAVGMADQLWVMFAAVIIAVGVMIAFANVISDFVERNPTLKMLALSFLILIGVMLLAEGAGTHIEKGYVYFAMAFSLIVEFLNMRVRSDGTKQLAS